MQININGKWKRGKRKAQTKICAFLVSSLSWFLPTKLTFNAKVITNDHLDFATDIVTVWFGKDSYADIWIKDKATDKPLTEVVRTAPPLEPRVISYPTIINNWLGIIADIDKPYHWTDEARNLEIRL